MRTATVPHSLRPSLLARERVSRVLARWAALALLVATIILWAPNRAEAQCTCPAVVPTCPVGCSCETVTSCGYTQGCGVRCAPGDTERILGLCAGGTQTQYTCSRLCPLSLVCTACQPGFFGPTCASCPGGIGNACNSNGSCDSGMTGSGRCTCFSGYVGAACQYSNVVTCSGHGVAQQDGSCVCSAGFAGPRCAQCATNFFGYPSCRYCDAPTTCSGHGACTTAGACACSVGWTGANCNQCEVGFFGPSCSRCPGTSSPCNGNGTCRDGMTGTGICACNAGYAGAACQHSNAVTCSGHGTAQTDGSCVCDAGFSGVRCERCAGGYFGYPSCRYCDAATTCSGLGSCTSEGLCMCSAGYVSEDCTSPVVLSSSLGSLSGTMTMATIRGRNFGIAGRVVLSGADALVSFWSDTTISFFVPGACTMVDVTVVRAVDGRSSASWRLCSASGDAGSDAAPADASGRGMDVATMGDASFDADDATFADSSALVEAGADITTFDANVEDTSSSTIDVRSADDAAPLEAATDVAVAADSNIDARLDDARVTVDADAGQPMPPRALCSVGRVSGSPARVPALWALVSAVVAASRLRRRRAPQG